MCLGCWEEYGSPTLQSEKIDQAADLISQIYSYSCVGSNAHIVLDDWNIEDEHVIWCLTEALKTNIHESTPEQLQIEKECLELLASMSIDERASALAKYDGYTAP